MTKISCEVSNCSHNAKGVCYANMVDIAGGSGKTEDDTCCSSFLHERIYAQLTNEAFQSVACDRLQCRAVTCAYNSQQLCTLEQIQVTGEQAEYYTQTDCASFFNKEVKV